MVNINSLAKPLSGDELTDPIDSKPPRQPRSKLHTCHICSEKFRKKDSLDRHIFRHTGLKSFACNFTGCTKTYSNKSHLSRHQKTAHTELPDAMIRCAEPGCHQLFTNRSNAYRHYQVQHTQRTVNACSDCGQTFRRKMQLKRHVMAKHNIAATQDTHKLHQCQLCTAKFTKWSALVKHRQLHHRSTAQLFTCDLCDKHFCRKPNIKEHMKLHTMADTVYMCHYDNCSKFYTALRNLNAHIRSKHEGKAGWTCDMCGQQLSTKQRLVQHLQAHLDPARRAMLQCGRNRAGAMMKLVPKNLREEMLERLKI